jgi:hypothetical protein
MDEMTPKASGSREPEPNHIDRRKFVRAGSGVLAVTILGISCDGDSTNILTSGRLRVVVTGHSGAAGSVRVIGTGVDVTVNIPESGIAEHDVPVGAFRVVYSPPPGFVLAQGQTSQRDVTVAPGATVQTAFLVVATTGSIRITVTGLATGAANGGSAQVQRTDIPGQGAVTVPISLAGTGTLEVSPGTYQVTFTPPAGHALAAGQTAVQSVTVGSGSEASINYALTVVPTTAVLRIVVNGASAGAANAGVAQIQRLDVPSVPTIQGIPSSGSVDVTLPAGSYSIAFTPPANHQLGAGQVNPQTAQLTNGQTTTIAFTITAQTQPTTGTIRVQVNGLGSAPTGGTATIQRTDAEEGPNVLTIAASGSAELTVAPGTYRVTYAPPTGFQLTPGNANPQTFIVTAGQTNNVTFTVAQGGTQPNTGTARINVSGLRAGATSGGTAQIARTDVTQAPVNVTIPGTGTIDVTVAVGSYLVTYTPPSGHQFATGETGQATMNITANQLSTVSFQVQQSQSGGGGAAIFFSDWATVSGTSQAAKTDNGKWNIISDGGNSLDVVPGGPVGMPTANCLRVIAKTSHDGFARLARTGLGTPNVGESWFYRWYYRHEQPLLGDNSQHPIETGSPLDWSFSNETISNTTWRPEFRPGGDQSNARLARWTGPVLQRSVTYRFELQIEKLSNTEMRMHARVYSAAGTLIADDDDFTNDRLGNTGSNLTSLASNPILHFATNGGTSLSELRAGNNGITDDGSWGPEMLYAYQGGFALRSGDWCGPYGSIQGEG